MNSVEQLYDAWSPIGDFILNATREEWRLEKLALELTDFAHVAQMHGKEQLSRGATQLARLVDVSATWLRHYPDDISVVDEMMEFVEVNVGQLEASIQIDNSNPKIDSMIELSNDAWSDYLLMAEGAWGQEASIQDQIDPSSGSVPFAENETQEGLPLGSEIELLLGAVTGLAEVAEVSEATETGEATKAAEFYAEDDFKPSDASAVLENLLVATDETEKQIVNGQTPNDVDQVAREELRADREMRDAYLDDSTRCVASMEAAALALDENRDDKEAIGAFCRELHTLKGASATVGLDGLAKHLHDLETDLEVVFKVGGKTNPESLFEAIDFVRNEMDQLNPQSEDKQKPTEPPEPNAAKDPQPVSPLAARNTRIVSSITATHPESSTASNYAVSDHSSIRVRASQLDRLMDMLAELVVLRNRRENNASEFDLLFGELSRCSTRLSIVEEQFGQTSTHSVVGEVSKDIEAVARGFRSLQKPVANDNAAITGFIRDFRHELMHLRRIPVSGLFGRLQRAARDAAKKEQKQVRVNVQGENTGLEQEIQERLYESLLHVVRNCVSHGIQSPEDRAASGKDEAGTITLEASASAQLLVIEVRDDGQGVNYDAIRKRGVEKGLIAANQHVSNAELANLIFHPGFSTKETASEISGRGVGMDVVATTLEQLRGRIEVESVTGKGTTIRLLIPRRTGIEHVMVFRSHDQLYALPMQSIVVAKKSREGFDSLSRLAFSSHQNRKANNVLVVKPSGRSADSQDARIAITVDELVGPEEVVVRGLPPMLRNHPLFCGVTLSGSGEKVLLLETESVADYCVPESESVGSNHGDFASESDLKALVVDDSITARKHISKLLKSHGYRVAEAGDGLEAIEALHRSTFDLVVTDLDMPRLGGLELLADIRNGKYCDAPVIVVSSRDDANFRQQALEYGARDFINKPVSKQHFQQRLESLGLTLAMCQE